jgi:hypothetical protein
MNAKNINIHIDRIVLDGLSISYHQESQFKAAVETELAHLLSAGGLSANLVAGWAVSQAPAGDIQVTNENNPTSLGQQVAQAVYEGLSK